MKFLRLLSRLIDELNIFVGQVSIWMILASTLISAGNALARYSFGIGSNALLEIQWYLFAAVFTLGAGYAFLRNVHVRIDFLAAKFSARGRNWVDVIGIIVFLFPLCYLMFTLAWPGGLIRWPLYAFIVVGFSLLALQGLSELIKRIEFLYFDGPDVLAHKEADPIATEA
jgi:TRAP-type mannitol/chloroaromatic compound transport system permease small subunit